MSSGSKCWEKLEGDDQVEIDRSNNDWLAEVRKSSKAEKTSLEKTVKQNNSGYNWRI